MNKIRRLKEEYNVNVSKECVRLHLDGLLYTPKDLRREPENANNDTNKIKKYDYVKHLLDYQAENIPIIWMRQISIYLFQGKREDQKAEIVAFA